MLNSHATYCGWRPRHGGCAQHPVLPLRHRQVHPRPRQAPGHDGPEGMWSPQRPRNLTKVPSLGAGVPTAPGPSRPLHHSTGKAILKGVQWAARSNTGITLVRACIASITSYVFFCREECSACERREDLVLDATHITLRQRKEKGKHTFREGIKNIWHILGRTCRGWSLP